MDRFYKLTVATTMEARPRIAIGRSPGLEFDPRPASYFMKYFLGLTAKSKLTQEKKCGNVNTAVAVDWGR